MTGGLSRTQIKQPLFPRREFLSGGRSEETAEEGIVIASRDMGDELIDGKKVFILALPSAPSFLGLGLRGDEPAFRKLVEGITRVEEIKAIIPSAQIGLDTFHIKGAAPPQFQPRLHIDRPAIDAVEQRQKEAIERCIDHHRLSGKIADLRGVAEEIEQAKRCQPSILTPDNGDP